MINWRLESHEKAVVQPEICCAVRHGFNHSVNPWGSSVDKRKHHEYITKKGQIGRRIQTEECEKKEKVEEEVEIADFLCHLYQPSYLPQRQGDRHPSWAWAERQVVLVLIQGIADISLASQITDTPYRLMNVQLASDILQWKSHDNDIPSDSNSSYRSVSAPRLQRYHIPDIPVLTVQDPQCTLVGSHISYLDPVEAVQGSEQSDH